MFTFKGVSELRLCYRVYAHFYNNGNKRLFADIVSNDAEAETPVQAYLVMINPGSCAPLNSKSTSSAKIEFPYSVCECKSDPAMKCAMWIMDLSKLNRLRILNLLDDVNPKLEEVKVKLAGSRTDDILKTSIFSKSRHNDFETVTAFDAPFILAWGVDTKFDSLKAQAMKCLKGKTILGIRSKNSSNPLSMLYIKPPNYKQQQQITIQLARQLIN